MFLCVHLYLASCHSFHSTHHNTICNNLYLLVGVFDTYGDTQRYSETTIVQVLIWQCVILYWYILCIRSGSYVTKEAFPGANNPWTNLNSNFKNNSQSVGGLAQYCWTSNHLPCPYISHEPADVTNRTAYKVTCSSSPCPIEQPRECDQSQREIWSCYCE